MKIRSSGGGTGSSREFSERTMFLYHFSQINDEAELDNVVILRSACPVRELEPCNPIPFAELRAVIKLHPRVADNNRGGGGGTYGPHNVHIDSNRQVVWLDAAREIPFGE